MATREQYELARDLFASARDIPSDINEHIPILREYAAKCEHVTELGTRYGTSAIGLCYGCYCKNGEAPEINRKVISYDISRSPFVDRVERAFPQFEARLGNSLLITIDETDLLFIDTLHRYDQVRVELERHHKQVRKWIILHDTKTFGLTGDDGSEGITLAIHRFLAQHGNEWVFKEQYTNCNGLTILARVSPYPRSKMYYPTITCICPTYGRPRLLNNAVACFLAQDYPKDRCRLVILDDLGTIHGIEPRYQSGRIIAYTTTIRFLSLPEKYNAGWRRSVQSDIYVVWEDDDVQLPWCLASHARALENRTWSHPSHVWSDYGERLHTEPVGGRFHGSLAMRGETLQRIGGWPVSKRADFDMQMIAALRETGEPGDPCKHSPVYTGIGDVKIAEPIFDGTIGSPPYIFRWHTGYEHGQSTMKGPDDESWYDNYAPPDSSGPHIIVPAFDSKTREYYELLRP